MDSYLLITYSKLSINIIYYYTWNDAKAQIRLQMSKIRIGYWHRLYNDVFWNRYGLEYMWIRPRYRLILFINLH